MENRSLITIGVALGVFMLWMLLFPDAWQAPPPAAPPAAAPTSPAASPPAAPPPASQNMLPASPSTPPAPGTPALPPPPASPLAVAPPPAAFGRPAEQVVVFEEPGLRRLELSTWGARVRSYQLLDPQYRSGDEQRNLIDIVKGCFGDPVPPPGAPRPLELVTAQEEPYWPLGLALPRSGLELTGRESYDLVAQGSDRALFRYRDPSGRVQIDKEYRLRAGSHFFDLFVRIHNLGSQPLPELTTLNTSGRQDPKAGDPGLLTGPGNLQRGVCYVRQEVIRTAVREVPPTGQVEAGEVLWAGADTTYFLQAILPDGPSRDGLDPQVCAFFHEGDLLNSVYTSAPREVLPGSSVQRHFTIYFGPKSFYQLKDAGRELQRAVDFSPNFFFFKIDSLRYICEPMLWLMQTFHGWTGNWGLAIILLTVFVKILLFYFNQKSFESMNAMAQLKPEMEALRAKCGDDKQKLNQEMMDLYKRHKINPMGGCLPMLLQMPIYIALYQTIFSTAELYKAEFFLHIQDLTAPDPYFVMPILLGVFTFIQQKIMPTATDNQQQKMMMYMMTFLFPVMMLFLPAGLVLYILANSVLTIGQQALIRRRRTARA